MTDTIIKNSTFFAPKNYFHDKSINEKSAALLLKKYYGASIIRRGDPEINEPDYYIDDAPFEMTFASDFNGRKSNINRLIFGDYSSDNIEKEMLRQISLSIENKVNKTYKEKIVNLCITAPVVSLIWCGELTRKLTISYHSRTRDSHLRNLRKKYLQCNKFLNILILAPGTDRDWFVYDLRENTVSYIALNSQDIASEDIPYAKTNNTEYLLNDSSIKLDGTKLVWSIEE